MNAWSGCSRHVPACCSSIREDLEQAERRGYGARHVYLGNGVQDDWFEDVQRVRHAPLSLLFIGRLVREKGLLDLLDALELVPGAELAIAGGRLSTDRDDIEPHVRARMSGSGLAGRVQLLGVLPRDRLRRRVHDSDVLVLPSYREGVPRSLIEGLTVASQEWRPRSADVASSSSTGATASSSRQVMWRRSPGHCTPWRTCRTSSTPGWLEPRTPEQPPHTGSPP